MKKLVALVLIFVFLLPLVGCQSNAQKAKDLMEKGPWADKAIWIDKNSQMYLVCTRDAGDVYADVRAFLLVDDEWVSSQLHLNQGVPIASFVTADGERLLEARAEMNGQKLKLYDFEICDESISRQYADMELSSFSYNEKMDEFPFEIEQ